MMIISEIHTALSHREGTCQKAGEFHKRATLELRRR